MRRKYRLKTDEEFERVRREGQSWRNRLLVLWALPNTLGYSRFGFAASRRLGKAVKRNRAKRLMREAARLHQPDVKPGWDLVFLARSPMSRAEFDAVWWAVNNLLGRANLLNPAGKETQREADSPLAD